MEQINNQDKLDEIRSIVTVVTSKMVIPLYFIFWILDWLVTPQLAWEFLGIRLLVLPCAYTAHKLIHYVKTFPAAQMVALWYAFMLAAAINSMIFMIGDSAVYVTPLHLVAFGALGFVPFSGGYFILAAVVIYLPYYIVEFSLLPATGTYNYMIVNTFMIFGLSAVTWTIKLYREYLRKQELLIRQSLVEEIDKRKQTEHELIEARDQALSANNAKSNFLANMSHELRTPLNAIIGYSELIEEELGGKGDTAAIEDLAKVNESAKHLLGLINNVLDLSKIEATQLELLKKEIVLPKLIKEVAHNVEPLMKMKNNRFIIENNSAIDKMQGDALRIKQCLLNLLGNAAKFTEHGQVKLSVYQDEDEFINFVITDTGVGIDKDKLKQIFNEFNQGDNETVIKYGGSGLGLSITRKLVELMGGEIDVESETGRGAAFRMSIPLHG